MTDMSVDFQERAKVVSDKYFKLYRRPPTAEEFNKEMGIVTVVEAARILLSVCDGAITKDGQGYNGLDSAFVRDVLGRMEQSGRPLSFKQEAAIYRTLKKYQVQLSGLGVDYDNIPVPVETTPFVKDEQSPMILDFVVDKYSDFVLYSRPDFSQQARAIPTAYWHPETKSWTYHNTIEVVQALDTYIINGVIKPTEKAIKAAARLRNVISARSTVQAIKNGGSDLAPTLSKTAMPVSLKPFAHQLQAFQIGITLEEAAFLMEQRTGKTLAAIGVAGYRYEKGQIKKVLIICPKTVSSVWIDEFKHSSFPYSAVDLTQKKESDRLESLNSLNKVDGLKVAVINHESTWRFDYLMTKWKPEMIIVDESQKIKNGRAKQSRFMHKMGDIARYKLILSGTPISQGPLDAWSQYRFLNPSVFGKSFVSFRDKYAIMGGYGGHEVLGYKNLPDLINKAHSIAFRITLDECFDMKEPTTQKLFVDLSHEEREVYNQMEKDFVVDLGTKEALAPIVLTQLLRLQQITGGFLPDSEGTVHEVGKVKLNVLKEFIHDLPKTKKVVIFCRFIPELKAIEAEMKSISRRAVTLYGATKGREGVRKQFRDDPETTIFIGQIQTGGLGIDLASADTVVFFSTNFSYTDFDQAKKRVLGPNQKHPVTYVHILARNTVDEDVLETLSDKKEMAHFILDKLRTRLGKIISERPFTKSQNEYNIGNGAKKINLGEEKEMAKSTKETTQEKNTEKTLTGKLSALKAESDKKASKNIKEEPVVAKETKATVKKEKVEKSEENENMITLKEILAKSDMDPKAARRTLRKNLEREEGARWAWEKDSAEYDKVLEILGLVEKPEKSTKKGTKAVKVEEPEEEPEEAPEPKKKVVVKKSKK